MNRTMGTTATALRGDMTDVATGTFRLADVFTKAITIYVRRFGPFVVLTVIAQIPQFVTLFVIGAPGAGSVGATGAGAVGAAGANVVSGLVGLVCSSIASGAIIYGVVQELRRRVFSVADSIQIAWRRLLPMIGVGICTGILAGLGAILLFIPGVMVYCAYYVSMPACVAEQAGVFASMSRSAFLTKGYRWQIFGMLLLILVIFAGFFILAVIAATALTSGGVRLIATQAVGAMVGAFNGVIVGVFYYQLRVAKEGVDIDRIASVFD
jgi:hypothetical protein